MDIRKAEAGDIPGISRLLLQVNQIHADHRPDLFKSGGIKYTENDLRVLLEDGTRPVYVAADEENRILGYVFCVLEETEENTSLRPVRTLYLDDLCVDAACRGKHIGSALYQHAVRVAGALGCGRVTLHAWNFNQEAMGFYEKMGMKPLVTTMEQRLKP